MKPTRKEIQKKLSGVLSKSDKNFGRVAFGDPDQKIGYPELMKLQGAKKSERNTDEESKLLDAIERWVTAARIDGLQKNLSLIKKGKKLFPAIFEPKKPNGTNVYRGLSQLPDYLIKALSKTNSEDWVAPKEKGGFYFYKKPITYKPHSDWQSWTYDERTAFQFGYGQAYLCTKQDNDFYFNTDVLNMIYNFNDEKEILHQGKTFTSSMYVYVAGEQLESMGLKFKKK